MQQPLQKFRVSLSNRRIVISVRPNEFKVVLLNQVQGTVSQQIFQDVTLPPASKYKFSSSVELFSYAEKYRDSAQSWSTTDLSVSLTFEPNNLITFNLIPLDASHVWPVLLDQIHFLQKGQLQTNSLVRQLQGSGQQKQKQKQMEIKLKGIGDLVQKLDGQNYQTREMMGQMSQKNNAVKEQLYKQLRVQNQKIEQLATKALNVDQKNQQKFKQISFNIDVNQKNHHRNFVTIRQQMCITNENFKKEIKLIHQIIERADLEKIKSDARMILSSFQNEIRIKDYVFEPDSKSIEVNKKIYFLNKKTLKCMEDTKDYFKIIGKVVIPYGRYHLRFNVKSIKNNGLLLGICTAKAKQQMQSILFNDRNCICINSCGYLINRGSMTSFLGRIKTGDNVRMLVSTSLGQIRWYCNDVQIAGAQLGELGKQQLFPMIGLGNFCDEIQLLDRQEKTKQEDINESYSMEMVRLNQKYSKRLTN